LNWELNFNSDSIEFKLHKMLFNIFIQMELIFHKINSLFTSIDYLIVAGNAQQIEPKVCDTLKYTYAKIVIHKWRQNSFGP
jgi:hypothetical protein